MVSLPNATRRINLTKVGQCVTVNVNSTTKVTKMLKSINFKNDSRDERSQMLTESLRLLDMMVHQCYCRNKVKSDDPDYEPRIVIYIGSYEYGALMDLNRNSPELADGDQYRGFPITLVREESHCRVFCLNPVVY